MNVKNMIIELSMELDNVEDGFSCPIELATNLKELEVFTKAALAQIKPLVIDELGGEKSKDINGFRIEKKAGRKNWNYSHISSYNELNKTYKQQKKSIEELAKMAYNRLQTVNNQPLIDSETGEIIEAAILTYSDETIAFKQLKDEIQS